MQRAPRFLENAALADAIRRKSRILASISGSEKAVQHARSTGVAMSPSGAELFAKRLRLADPASSPAWMWREPPEPMAGLEAQTSGVARTSPTLGRSGLCGWNHFEKIGWFSRLKNSARNWSFVRSFSFQNLTIGTSPSTKWGPRKMLRPCCRRCRWRWDRGRCRSERSSPPLH
jgi:hypothetical protein